MKKHISLEYLLSGFDIELFLNEFYGNKHLYISRNDIEFYKSIFSIERYDSLINENIFSSKFLKISKLNSNLDKSLYSVYDSINKEHQINIAKSLELFLDGYTIVIDEVSQYDRNILDLEIDLSNNLKFVQNISTNSYLTPKESQAFPLHYDVQDVFILQIYGSKKWQIFPDSYNPKPLDFSYEYLLDEIKEQNLEGTTLTLTQGDLLYLPRGMSHEVSTNLEASLHLTISVVNYTISDLVEKCIHQIKKENSFFRTNINSNKNAEEYKKMIISNLQCFDFQSIISNLENKNKYNSLVNLKGTLLNNINPPNLLGLTFFFRKDVKIYIENDLETVFEYGHKKTSIEGDFTFLSKIDTFDIQLLNKSLNNSELAEELLYYLIFEGFATKTT
jgi:hypothetical protein